MSDTRQIKNRYTAVADVGKLTGTMEMISRARYHKHLESWKNRKEFDDGLAQLAYLLLASGNEIKHPLMEESKEGKRAILVMGSDRGLCGGFNNNINHLVDVHIKRAQRLRKELLVFACGKKAIAYLKSKKIPIEKEFPTYDEDPGAKRIDEIADSFIGLYEDKTINYFGVIYTRFFSLASQRAQTLTLLPVSDLIDDLTTSATVIWPWETEASEFEVIPSIDEVFNSLIYMMIRTALSGCFLDSALSEHLYRVVAMKNATDNADSMKQQLMGDYNRARQSQITGEIMDIVGGSEGMK
jgi:F-type H+-transporting ATPase subunit gamma